MKKQSVNNPAFTFSLPKRYSDTQLAPHLIGYTDYNNDGVCGIEKDYNTFLKSIQNKITLKTYTDAKGNLLWGKGTQADYSHCDKSSGVKLTLDFDIQSTAQAEGARLKKGCVIVLDSGSGEVLACASYPAFNPNKPAEALDNQDKPFINRALSLYNVGSVFKLMVCMAALENGIRPGFSVKCTGSTRCGSVTFHCHNEKGHGTMNMKTAFANSCNTYFIALAEKIGFFRIIELCEKLEMSSTYKLTDSMLMKAAALPTKSVLSSPAGLANFSFGQGELLCTPMMLANLYSVINNGGYLNRVKLVQGTVRNSKFEPLTSTTSKRVISAKTAFILQQFMYYAVTNGTGATAQSSTVKIGGKTATAQTGKYLGNRECLISYFIGVFSIKSDKYTVLVMKENGTSGSGDCAPIVKRIAEKIYCRSFMYRGSGILV